MRLTNYKLAIATALFILGLYLLPSGSPADLWLDGMCLVAGDVTEDIKKIERKYGMEIKYDMGSDAIPDIYRNPPSSATAKPITKLNLCRYFPIFMHEIKKYPTEIIRRDLSAVYLFSQLSFYGVDYGGTSLNSSLYLTGGDRSQGYNENYFVNLIHHEMSSIFFRKYSFPKEAWSSINSSNFSYAEADKQVLKAVEDGGKSEGNAKLYGEGFLAEYGYSTLENDFNLYVEMAFAQPKQLKILRKKYPRIRQKSDLVKSFYYGISKDFLFD